MTVQPSDLAEEFSEFKKSNDSIRGVDETKESASVSEFYTVVKKADTNSIDLQHIVAKRIGGDKTEIIYFFSSRDFLRKVAVRVFLKSGEILRSVREIFPAALGLEQEISEIFNIEIQLESGEIEKTTHLRCV